jgi:hypothetical protein
MRKKMTEDDPAVEQAAEAYPIEVSDLDSGEIEPRTSTSLTRLLVGGILEGSSLLLNWLDVGERRRASVPDSEAQAGEDPDQRAKQAAIGLTFRSAEAASDNLNAALRISEKVGGALLAPARRIFNTRPFRPLRKRFDNIVARGEQEMEDWIQLGAEEESRSRALARETAYYVLEDVVRYLANSPALEALVNAQTDRLAGDLPQTTQIDVLVRVLANNYITYLSENPDQVQGLIRAQGDTYLAHLEENPEPVQTLVQGQSAGLIEDITGEIRQFTVTADSLLELLARKLFRRSSRAELPEPSPEVQARAPFARLEGDFSRRRRRDHD